MFLSSRHGTLLSRALALGKVSLNSEPFSIRVQLTGYIRTVFLPEDLEIDSLQDDGSVFSVRGTDGDYTPNHVKRFLKL